MSLLFNSSLWLNFLQREKHLSKQEQTNYIHCRTLKQSLRWALLVQLFLPLIILIISTWWQIKHRKWYSWLSAKNDIQIRYTTLNSRCILFRNIVLLKSIQKMMFFTQSDFSLVFPVDDAIVVVLLLLLLLSLLLMQRRSFSSFKNMPSSLLTV